MAQIFIVLCGNLAKCHYKPWEMCIIEFKVNHFKGTRLRVTLIRCFESGLEVELSQGVLSSRAPFGLCSCQRPDVFAL